MRFRRTVGPGAGIVALLCVAFIYLPIGVVAISSFNDSRFGLRWAGFTLEWYQALLDDEIVLSAARNTLLLATLSTAISSCIGTLLGYGMHLRRLPGAKALSWLLYVPVVTPDIVMAVALLSVYAALRALVPPLSPWLEPGLPAMVIGHVTLQVAFVAIVVRSRLATLDPALEEAARDLYAGPIRTFRHVVLPLAAPGIVAGALLAFTLSIDDFVIAFFTSGPESTTLPTVIYASVKRGITPDINAASTLVTLLTMLTVVGMALVGGRRASSGE